MAWLDSVVTPHGDMLFDDTVLDKHASHKIELVRRQCRDNETVVIKGIGVVTCVDFNPATDQCWLIDFRLDDPDGKTKLEHVRDMLANVVHQKRLAFQAVRMDRWYAAKNLMLFVESLGKVYDCLLKANRQVDDFAAAFPDRWIDALDWSPEALVTGKTINLNGFPNDHTRRLFRVEVSSHCMDWVVCFRIRRKRCAKRAASAGRSSRPPGWKPASAEWPVSSVTPWLRHRGWGHFASAKWRCVIRLTTRR